MLEPEISTTSDEAGVMGEKLPYERPELVELDKSKTELGGGPTGDGLDSADYSGPV